MTETKSRVHPDATEEMAMAMIAWHNGLLKIGKTKAEDVPLPWNLRIFAWFTRKLGLNLLDLTFICRDFGGRLTNWQLCKGITKLVARKFWRWLRLF